MPYSLPLFMQAETAYHHMPNLVNGVSTPACLLKQPCSFNSPSKAHSHLPHILQFHHLQLSVMLAQTVLTLFQRFLTFFVFITICFFFCFVNMFSLLFWCKVNNSDRSVSAVLSSQALHDFFIILRLMGKGTVCTYLDFMTMQPFPLRPAWAVFLCI